MLQPAIFARFFTAALFGRHPGRHASLAPPALAALAAAILLGGSVLPAGAADGSASADGKTAAVELSAAEIEAGFQPLFKGHDLSGWEGDPAWFRVAAETPAIVAGTLQKPIPHNVFLCTTETYGDFELRLEAKLIGQGDNAGIQFRTKRLPESTEVSGYQADMGRAWNRPVWGALYDESRRRKMLAEPDPEQVEKVLQGDGWNEIIVRCRGPRIEIFLNGLQTVDYTEADPEIARRGVIALQIHSGPPAEAWYRNIRLRPL